jgi:hypothetical protein
MSSTTRAYVETDDAVERSSPEGKPKISAEKELLYI